MEYNVDLFECKQQTYRAKAVSYSASMLGTLGKKGGKAVSYTSFVHFPAQGAQSPARWYNPSKELEGFRRNLSVLQKPRGVTPYDEGLSGALKLLRNVPDASKPKIVIFVTDGFPTDPNPKAVLSKARNIRTTLKAKLISLMVTGQKSQQQLREKHQGIIKMDTASFSGWKDQYSTIDAYFLDLLGNGSAAYPGLLTNMSDKVIFVEESGSLTREIDGIVAKEALSCR